MNKEAKLSLFYGEDEFGFANITGKISNIKISRIINAEGITCSRCFPHGIDTKNSHYHNSSRNWKQYRKKQYRRLTKF